LNKEEKMKRFLVILILVLCFGQTAAAKEINLGEQLTLTETTKISLINAQPQEYIGKMVRVEGLIIDVCAKRGCWMDLASDLPFEKIQIKVVDGVIVFPMEAKGRTAIVEGVVQELKLDEEMHKRFAAHQAYERGEKFDPSTVKGPLTLYRIRGLGAKIL